MNTRRNHLIFNGLYIFLLLLCSLDAQAKRFKDHWASLCNTIVEAWVDRNICTYEEALEALPYAEFVLAHTNDVAHEAMLAGYTLLDREALPASLQEYFHAIEVLPLQACMYENFGACLRDPFEKIESHTLQGLGLKARIYESLDRQHLVVVFSGSEAEFKRRPIRAIANWATNVGQGLGRCSQAYALALEWVKALQQKYVDHTIICTGISLGAGLSQYVAACLGLRAYCFNSPRLAGCQLEHILPTDHSQRIKHYTVELEILNLPVNFFEGDHIGSLCQIPSYNIGLNFLERHFTEHAIQSLKVHIEQMKRKL